nr:MAG TPA: hypothetical protein [Microviridae sp.]
MMVDQTGNRVHGHRASSPVLDVDISKKLIADSRSNCKHTIHVRLVLTNPRIRKHRQSGIIIGQMPNIKGLSVLRTHLTGNTRGLIAVISPRFLIAENLIIDDVTGRILHSRALRKNLLVLHGLLTDIRKNRPIVIKAILTRPETFKTLLISMIVPSDHNADNKTMFRERFGEIRMSIRSDRHTSNGTLCSLTRSRSGLLHNLIDVNRDTITTEILGTLKTSIGRSHTKMRFKNLDVTGTTASVFLVELLNLERHAELINRSTKTTGRNSIKVNRVKTRLVGTTTKTSNTSIIGTRSNGLESKGIVDINRSVSRSKRNIRNTGQSISTRIMRLFTSNNRIFAGSSRRNQNIRAFLRRRKAACKVIVILSSLIGKTAFRDVGHESAGIHTGYSSIIDGNNERVR